MGKRKPDQTVNLRIELQDYERRALASAQTASAIKDFADAVDKLSSFENLYVVATVLEIVTGKEILPGTPNDVYQLIDWLRDAGHDTFRDPGNPDASLWEAFWDVNLKEDWKRFFGGDDD